MSCHAWLVQRDREKITFFLLERHVGVLIRFYATNWVGGVFVQTAFDCRFATTCRVV